MFSTRTPWIQVDVARKRQSQLWAKQRSGHCRATIETRPYKICISWTRTILIHKIRLYLIVHFLVLAKLRIIPCKKAPIHPIKIAREINNVLETSVKVLELEARSFGSWCTNDNKNPTKNWCNLDQDFICCVKQILIRSRRWASNQSRTQTR